MIIQQTIHYQTYLMAALTEGLQGIFVSHPDKFLRKVRVAAEWVEDKATYPLVLVRFYGRDILNAGVAHKEWIEVPSDDDPDVMRLLPRERSIYHGDVQFEIYAMSTTDRAILSDAIIQVLRFGDAETYTQAFLDRIYADENTYPEAEAHYINIDTDRITPMGDTQVRPPWDPEDRMLYTSSYRVAAMGELRSRIPEQTGVPGLVSAVTVYPYISQLGQAPPDPDPDPNSTGPDAHGPWLDGTEGLL